MGPIGQKAQPPTKPSFQFECSASTLAQLLCLLNVKILIKAADEDKPTGLLLRGAQPHRDCIANRGAAGRHGAATPFFSSAGQFTITVNGSAACCQARCGCLSPWPILGEPLQGSRRAPYHRTRRGRKERFPGSGHYSIRLRTSEARSMEIAHATSPQER